MTPSQHQGFENEQIQRALQQGDTVIGVLLGRHPA
jgi:hypothetical protein